MVKNICFIIFFALFMHGVSDIYQVSVSVISGDSVTLHTGVETNQQDRIRWYNKDIRIAQTTEDQSKICTDVQCNEGTERFRDRLKLDHQTGSLTIMNITTTDAGIYMLQIIKNSNISEEIFIVAVHRFSTAEQDKMKEGEPVTLYAGLMKNPNDLMRWFFNETLIAEITGDQSKICTDEQCKERFRDRLKLDSFGSLIITNTRTADSGDYQLQISSSRFSILKRFSVNVTDSHVETSALDQSSGVLTIVFVSIILALLVVASAVGVIYWCLCSKAKPKGLKYGVTIVLKIVGQSFTLDTGIEVHTDDHIKWMFGDNKSLIAQIKDGTREITAYNDDGDARFIDRLELDHQTGSLTIRNSRTTDSGDYQLQINRSGKTSFKRFSVTVSDSPETRTILLYQSENKIPLMEKLPTTPI